MAYCIFPFYLQ